MTLHYHGTPITPLTAMQELVGRCFCVSFARPDQVRQAHELGQSVMLDNGAFTFWQRRQEGKMAGDPDWPGYYAWCEQWLVFQTTWAVIPDVIDGTDAENDALIAEWPFGACGAPVWHMHEPLDRLLRLADEWPLVCIGSSGAFAKLNTPQWHRRMDQAMNRVCPTGTPKTRLHMLRGMAQAGSSRPFFSLDSSDIGQNHSSRRATPRQMAERWDGMQCAPIWHQRSEQSELDAA